jgi:hypothetical protein
MLYLLDANVLIDANRDYYSIDRIPEFWDWLIYKGELGEIKIPVEIYDEIKIGTDDLAAWAKQSDSKAALILDETVDVLLVQRVLKEGYADDLTDDEAQRLGRDPFLIAYALRNIRERCIVTTEGSKPKKERANKHIPNVCENFKIKWCHSFELVRVLGFSTRWEDYI